MDFLRKVGTGIRALNGSDARTLRRIRTFSRCLEQVPHWCREQNDPLTSRYLAGKVCRNPVSGESLPWRLNAILSIFSRTTRQVKY